MSCSSLATVLCVLRLSCVSQKTQTNRKEDEQVENSLRQPCDLVSRTEVLRCCSQHREAAVRNQKICRRRKVHGCRKADVKGIQGRTHRILVSSQKNHLYDQIQLTSKTPLHSVLFQVSAITNFNIFSSTILLSDACMCQRQWPSNDRSDASII